MSRYDLLPPNATPLERDVSRAVSSLQRVAPPVPIIRTAKRTNIPDSVVPWLIYEYGLGEILPYLGNDQRLALRDGVLWQRIRGTPESVRVALGWIGIEGLIEEPERGTLRWAEYMLGLSAATQGEEIIDRITAVARISSPVRSRLQRIYAVYDFRRAVYDQCDWDEGAIYDDHSGVRPRPEWPQISYGRIYSTYLALSVTVSTTQAVGMATLVEAYERFRWDESQWDEGWHALNPESMLTIQDGRSGQYEGQVWSAFRWLQDEPWPAINVVVSSALNGTPTDPPVVGSITLAATGIENSSLNQGDVVSVEVAMSRPVVVTGSPLLTLNIGGTSREATYSSGSGTATLTFTYTIQAGDNAVGGIAVPSNSIALNGGTIRDSAGNVAILVHTALPTNPSFIVDTITPSPPTLTISATTGMVEVSGIEPGAVWEYSINYAAYSSCPTTSFGLTPVCTSGFSLPPGTYPAGAVRVRQRDAAGNVSAAAENTGSITVDTTPPAAPVITPGPGPAQVGVTAEAASAVTVVFSRTGGGTVTKSVTGNGATPVLITLSEAEQATLGTGTINVSATATDAAGNTSTAGTASFTLTIDQGFNAPNFTTTDGLNLVGVNSVVNGEIFLTTSAEVGQTASAGNVWQTTARKYNRDWSTAWRMQMGGGGGLGADGFTIQWHTSSTALGTAGDPAGRVQSASVPYALTIRTFVFNEFKLYAANNLVSSNSLGFDARQDLYYWLDYSHANSRLQIFVSTTSAKPGTVTREYTGIVFGNTDYYIGIGAATGGFTDNHILKAWSLTLL